jgi:hypothetical protein
MVRSANRGGKRQLLVGILTVDFFGRPNITDKALHEFLRRAEAREWQSRFWRREMSGKADA